MEKKLPLLFTLLLIFSLFGSIEVRASEIHMLGNSLPVYSENYSTSNGTNPAKSILAETYYITTAAALNSDGDLRQAILLLVKFLMEPFSRWSPSITVHGIELSTMALKAMYRQPI